MHSCSSPTELQSEGLPCQLERPLLMLGWQTYVQMVQACKAFARRWDPYKTEADGFDALFPKGTPMDLPGATDLYLMAMDAIYALEVRVHHGMSALGCQ